MEHLVPFRIALAVLLGTGLVLTSTFRLRASRAAGGYPRSRGRALLLLVGLRCIGLGTMANILGFIIRPDLLGWSFLDAPTWLRWIGLAMALASLGALAWMLRHLGSNITPTVTTRANHSLVTSGPYRWIRHPLYTFGILLGAGIFLMTASWPIGLILMVGIVLLMVRTPIEEAHLIARFGDDYRAYMTRTGRYLPRLTPFAHQQEAAKERSSPRPSAPDRS